MANMKNQIVKENIDKIVSRNIRELSDLVNSLDKEYIEQTVKVANIIYQKLCDGATIFLCGNGGSASDCQHFSSELVGKFKNKRKPLRAISLTTDTSILTNIANDFSYDLIFSRQIEGLSKRGDILFSISTSGESENIINAILKAKELGLETISLLGKNGGKAINISKHNILVPSSVTARIQEIHTLTEHIICELIEEAFGFD